MEKKVVIGLHELADSLEIRIETLRSWLGHYTLGKYVEKNFLGKAHPEKTFVLNDESIRAMRRYLFRKRKKYLNYFEKRILNKN